MTRRTRPKRRLAMMVPVLAAAGLAQFGYSPAAAEARDGEARPVLQVGPDRPYKMPSEAAAAAPDGAIIEIDAGSYPGDAVVWPQNRLTLRGRNGKAHVQGGSQMTGDRALWVVTGDDVVIENMIFSGAGGTARAALLATGRGLQVRDSAFSFNRTAIEVTDRPDSEVLIERSTLEWNGKWAEAVKVGAVANLTIRFTDLVGSENGVNLSSRARRNDILCNRIMDTAVGSARRLVEVRGGGTLRLYGNLIAQGPSARGSVLVDYEDAPGDSGGLYVVHNTFVAGRDRSVVVRNAAADEARIVNNAFVTREPRVEGAKLMRGNVVVGEGGFVDPAQGDYRLRAGAAAIDAGVALDAGDGFAAGDGCQYLYPQQGHRRSWTGPPDAGAYELELRNPRLDQLPVNRWTKLPDRQHELPTRRVHMGVAYDERRGNLLIFGAETHGRDFDNSLYAYNIVNELWTRLHPDTPASSYRGDAAGYRISGFDGLYPWAMHVYDNLLYDPSQDALVLTSSPKHVGLDIAGATRDPTWIYDLETGKWRIFDNQGKPGPVFFGAGSAYDSRRDVIVAYNALAQDAAALAVGDEAAAARGGLWELGPDRREWRLAHPASHNSIWFTVAYDSRRGQIAVFGDRSSTGDVWTYTPGPIAGARGEWAKKSPGGDSCPAGMHFPAEFDPAQGVFLLLPLDPKIGKSVTCVYDPGTNTYRRVPGGEIEPLKMNYTMVYDSLHGVFILVTGDYWRRRVAEVWAFKLDLAALDGARERGNGKIGMKPSN